MQISVNNRVEEIPTEGIQFFGQLMERLSKQAQNEGGTVLAVKLNGSDVTGRDRSQLDELPLGDVQQLEINTGDPKVLARATLYSVADFLEKLLTELQSTAELFRLGNSERSARSFLRCIDGLQVFMHTLESCRRLLGISFELIFIPSDDTENITSVAENRRALFGILDSMIEAQSDQDWVLLADMIEYELVQSLEDWREIIPAILEKTKPDHPTLEEFSQMIEEHQQAVS
ncbi:MAG: hypothetical protein NTW14_02190 [bacterium]|nr:hypothetical protein [bacterium]